MSSLKSFWSAVAAVSVGAIVIASPAPQGGVKPAAGPNAGRLDAFKSEAQASIEEMRNFTQQMVDQMFSFAEPGFQEIETSRYLVDLLKKNGFSVQEGIGGIPTAWV